MNVIDRLRVERAVQSYEFWLELGNLPWRRRRDLSRELRSNLRAAAEQQGVPAAVAGLGSIRRLAAETSDASPPRPRWRVALQAALLTAAGVLFLEYWQAAGWLQAASELGTGPCPPPVHVAGPLRMFPGSTVQFVVEGNTHLTGWTPGWSCLAVGLLAFVVVARPWRTLTRASR
jgi:hypothetical protein